MSTQAWNDPPCILMEAPSRCIIMPILRFGMLAVVGAYLPHTVVWYPRACIYLGASWLFMTMEWSSARKAWLGGTTSPNVLNNQ